MWTMSKWLQCVAVRCSVLQCAVVCCTLLSYSCSPEFFMCDIGMPVLCDIGMPVFVCVCCF